MTVMAPRIGDEAALVAEARRIAREVAAPVAAAVDREARLPVEAIEALRGSGLLGAMVPRALGGHGAGIRAVAGACFELGQGCASAAMVFAMHQIQVACLRHGEGGWHDGLLRRVAGGGGAAGFGDHGGDVRRRCQAERLRDVAG